MNKEVENALKISEKYLTEVKRLSGDSEFDHALRVKEILSSVGVTDSITGVISLAHHVMVLDPKMESNMLSLFGQNSTNLLLTYSKLTKTKIAIDSPKDFNEAYILQTYLSLSDDMRVLVVRLADKIDSLHNSVALLKKDREILANRSLYLYLPLAKMLGLNSLAQNFEEEAFKIINPGEYHKIKRWLLSNKKDLEIVLNDTKEFISELLEKNGYDNYYLSGRIKSTYSLYKKFVHQGIFESGKKENIKDLLGIRIITNTIQECYEIEGLLRSYFDDYMDFRDDYVSKPRKSGYQSLHGIYKLDKKYDAEIQIRTYEMNEYSEFGPASHLLYKAGDKGASSLVYNKFKKYTQNDPYWFKNLNYFQSETDSPGSISNAPFSKNVYAFTPQNDIIELKAGSTLLDFAYELHSDIGDRCESGFVNKMFVGLGYLIQNGDVIQIRTGKNKNVSADWLRIAKTTKAKSFIRRELKSKALPKSKSK